MHHVSWLSFRKVVEAASNRLRMVLIFKQEEETFNLLFTHILMNKKLLISGALRQAKDRPRHFEDS